MTDDEIEQLVTELWGHLVELEHRIETGSRLSELSSRSVTDPGIITLARQLRAFLSDQAPLGRELTESYAQKHGNT